GPLVGRPGERTSCTSSSSSMPTRVGIELELLVHDVRSPGRPTSGPAFDPLRRSAAALPVDGRVTIEPGGQLEISSAPAESLITALATAQRDLDRLRNVAADHGATLIGAGYDPRPAPVRVLDHPRYTAMEAYLDHWGPPGRMMMRSTASVQVNLEAAAAGQGSAGWQHRWDLLHTIGPALVAAFATSPGRNGRWKGWSSTRQAVWLALDPRRTAEPMPHPGETLPRAWARWCLDAPLMMVRRDHGPWTAPPGVRFTDWIQAGRALIPDRPGPTWEDLNYHLTTLFPPVRARGHLEVRYLDAQPGDWWQVPVSVLSALVTDPAAGDRAILACEAQRGRWLDAARMGLRDAGLARAARTVLDAAAGALGGDPSTSAAAPAVEAYLEHWTGRARSPGDDLREGRPLPDAPRVVVQQNDVRAQQATRPSFNEVPCSGTRTAPGATRNRGTHTSGKRPRSGRADQPDHR
ncbi:MAG TPA: glutamate-cysteine ligase family protein, partial [Kineosporiaceae bacterium]|nr:glutamate-cysteine ligase family protein [Kineosporiaceae bacterium]